ncbi:hypothetical protein MKK75_06545, partial [Methylobacterium sp. J-030]|uniref:hypothetical protein n=1 Tax=Methylobacterium sp. J-030 TaxID=2836627 RepID=UPI001FBBB1DF
MLDLVQPAVAGGHVVNEGLQCGFDEGRQDRLTGTLGEAGWRLRPPPVGYLAQGRMIAAYDPPARHI